VLDISLSRGIECGRRKLLADSLLLLEAQVWRITGSVPSFLREASFIFSISAGFYLQPTVTTKTLYIVKMRSAATAELVNFIGLLLLLLLLLYRKRLTWHLGLYCETCFWLCNEHGLIEHFGLMLCYGEKYLNTGRIPFLSPNQQCQSREHWRKE